MVDEYILINDTIKITPFMGVVEMRALIPNINNIKYITVFGEPLVINIKNSFKNIPSLKYHTKKYSWTGDYAKSILLGFIEKQEMLCGSN